MDFLSPVLNLISSRLICEYARIHGISGKLKSWGEKLPTIRAVLDSAEEKQMYQDDPAIVLWLADLRDLAYDMEDLLDLFSVDAKRDHSKLPRCLIGCCSRFRPRTLISDHHMANEIEDIDRRLEAVVERIPVLGLVQNSWSVRKTDHYKREEMEFLSPVLHLVHSLLRDEYSQIHGISNKLQLWDLNLRKIQSMLDSDKENQRYNDDPATLSWVADLRDIAKDMEDLLDHFSPDAKRNTFMAQSSKFPHCLISCFSPFRPRTPNSGRSMTNRIEDIDRRLEEVVARIPIQFHNDLPRFRTSSVPERMFVGREKQMEELLARLTRSEAATGNSFRPFSVISIVGMGGLGKTTLAQELYMHEALENADFVVKAWVCVSDIFDKVSITKSILDQIAPSSSGTEKDFKQLQISLRETLSGKKFLLVLDDVWNDNYEELESLLKPLYSGSKGSRILLTTRNLEVARMMGDRDPKQLEHMSMEECLSLLAHHSIGEPDFHGHPHLQDISVQLVNKCKGLPLSIETIGGMLRFESDDEKWRLVLAHDSWDRDGGKIPPALKLSYVHLPIHLKRCFTACALFSKDYVFDQDELIRLWIIQGLLRKRAAKSYQEVGIENVRQLEARSLLQKVHGKTLYTMHDLVNDLAKSVDACSYFSSDKDTRGFTLHLDKVRHAAMVLERHERCLLKRFDVYRSMKKLRTFMPFQITEVLEPNVYVSQDVIQDLFMDMKNLKLLSLRYFNITRVPDQIGDMKLLHSVDFSYTNIQMLPESICDLVELQFLLLRGCKELESLPRNIHKLSNLLHLDIIDTHSLQEMPSRIGDLTNLEILSDFVVGKGADQRLKQLGPLECLQGELNVHNLMNVDDVEDARIANLQGKEAVLKLSLDWGSSSEISHEDQFKLLDYMRPPRKIESLAIHGYGAKRFPSWFDNHYSTNHVLSITLRGCRSVESLPPLGQLPLLERLDMSFFEGISSIGPEFYGSGRPCFPSLRSLSFEDMGAWEKWLYHGEDENDKPFPCLRQLIVKECPKLKGGCTLSLPSLVELHIDGCNGGLFKWLACLTSTTKMEIGKIPELVHFEGSLSTSWVALEEMKIVGCPRFKSFVEVDGEQVPPKLKFLEISGCGELENVPEYLFGLPSLSEMSIVDCEKFSCFPNGELPVSLRKLMLRKCPRLPQSQLISSGYYLEEVSLHNVEGLMSITELAGVGSPLSQSLLKLEIVNCRSLTTLTDNLQHLSVLFQLSLWDCPTLETSIFPSLPFSLSYFILYSCPKVKDLPRDMHTLESLKSLSIENCEGIERLPPKGLPPNLESLCIGGCKNLNQPIQEWGLRGLTGLQEFSISGGMGCLDEMERFPPGDEDWSRLFPSSLLRLSIRRMKKLERMGGGLKHHLVSLQSLIIFNCPRLRQLPADGLPDSLERLYIWGCTAELEEKCRKGEGEYWPHLRLIPEIYIPN